MYPLNIPAEGAGLGGEGCGVVEELGENVSSFKVGDQVAYVSARTGAYAELALVDAEKVIQVNGGEWNGLGCFLSQLPTTKSGS